MYAWQFAMMQHAASVNGWTRFVSMQHQHNLIRCEEQREMLPLLAGPRRCRKSVQRIAADRGVAMATVTLAWAMNNPTVTPRSWAPPKPTTSPDAVAALDLELAAGEARRAPAGVHAASAHLF